ncbi:hypothetical protein [Maridesulfovibrio sp.]|uniref:hypothetical protein n=1 Tax=Maridesulfovibrio sp. TaxID=2795000 RepID=UPI0029C9FA27|nr:hypothetical protein [Maridesulfovibrio sp.]
METKPPLGIMPRKLHDESRLKALYLAAARYNQAEKTVPAEWADEMLELEVSLELHEWKPKTLEERLLGVLFDFFKALAFIALAYLFACYALSLAGESPPLTTLVMAASYAVLKGVREWWESRHA